MRDLLNPPPTESTRLSWPTLAAIVVTGAIGEVFIYVSPLLVGSITEGFKATEGNAGLIVATEVASSALLAFFIARRLSLLNARILVLLSLSCIVAADAISATTSSLLVLIVCRIVAGAGSGVALASANATAASCPNPRRTFSILTLTVVAAATLAYLAVPEAVERLGPKGAFLALAVLTAIGVPVALGFPSRIKDDSQPLPGEPVLGVPQWSMMLAVGLLYLGQNALWAYVERIAHSAGLPLDTVANVLIANSALAMAAPLLAQAWRPKNALVVPVSIGMGVQILTALTLPYSAQLITYSASAILFTFGFMFVVPIIKTLMARMDPSGRLAGSSMAFMTIGSAVGPALAGLALNAQGDYFTIAWIAAVTIFLSTVLVLWTPRAVSLSPAVLRSGDG